AAGKQQRIGEVLDSFELGRRGRLRERGTPGNSVGCSKCSTPNTSMAATTNTRPTVTSVLLPCPTSDARRRTVCSWGSRPCHAASLLGSERDQRIRRTCAARRHESRRGGGKAEDEDGGADGREVGRVEAEEKAREQPRHRDRRGDAGGGAESHRPAELDHQTAH